jgi:diphthamide biosynthesis protein 7
LTGSLAHADGIEVVHHHTGSHTSLAYGVDWSYHTGGEADGGSLVGSCSFYDKTFSVWQPPPRP